jgi:hypothetical protein
MESSIPEPSKLTKKAKCLHCKNLVEIEVTEVKDAKNPKTKCFIGYCPNGCVTKSGKNAGQKTRVIVINKGT